MSLVLFERGTSMKADVGDRLVTEGPDETRECLIIGLQRADGAPPYVVRWLADGHIALVFPGPYTRLVHSANAARAEGFSGDFSTGDFSTGDLGTQDSLTDEAQDAATPEGIWPVRFRESHDIN
jgi:hypothetical protein